MTNHNVFPLNGTPRADDRPAAYRVSFGGGTYIMVPPDEAQDIIDCLRNPAGWEDENGLLKVTQLGGLEALIRVDAIDSVVQMPDLGPKRPKEIALRGMTPLIKALHEIAEQMVPTTLDPMLYEKLSDEEAQDELIAKAARGELWT